jgi:hypothetical protein
MAAVVGGMTLASGPASIVSPQCISYSPDAYLNISSSQLDQVNITGIHNKFSKLLSLPEAASILNMFQVTGFSIDKTLGNADPVAITAGMVELRGGTYATGAKSVIANLLARDLVSGNVGESLVKDSGNKIIDQYLADQLHAAFMAAFGSKISAGVIGSTVDGLNVAGYTGSTGATAGPAAATENASGAASTSITTTTTITGFAVDVITNGASAAANLWDQHDANEAAIASLYRQIPKSTYNMYLAEGSGAVVPLITTALPLKGADKLTFVFDINVNTAAARPGSTVTEDVPTIANQPVGVFGTTNFSLDLATRRVAVELIMPGVSGVTIAGLVLENSASPEAAVPVEGVNQSGTTSS